MVAGFWKKAALLYASALLVCGLMFFLPAGTFDYWQAWAYLAIIAALALFVILYFMKNDPEFLERRLQMREKEAQQKRVVAFGLLIFIVGFLLPGFDKRYGWSFIPFEYVVAADAVVLLGYWLVFLVFRENSYAGRTVRVEKGQKVISTGPYSVIRHPMYFGMIFMYLATPIALGSYVAFPVFLLVLPMLVFRILNEEEVLGRELPGYKEYCKRVRYRLIPFVW